MLERATTLTAFSLPVWMQVHWYAVAKPPMHSHVSHLHAEAAACVALCYLAEHVAGAVSLARILVHDLGGHPAPMVPAAVLLVPLCAISLLKRSARPPLALVLLLLV